MLRIGRPNAFMTVKGVKFNCTFICSWAAQPSFEKAAGRGVECDVRRIEAGHGGLI